MHINTAREARRKDSGIAEISWLYESGETPVNVKVGVWGTPI